MREDEFSMGRATADDGRIRVLHITGTGRSGSTLLARLLGSVPGVFAAGEVRFLWERGLAAGGRCGCRLAVRECPVWAAVIERLGPAADPEQAAAFHDRLRVVLRLRRAGRWLRRRPLPLSAVERTVADGLLPAYRSIQDVTSAELIVDSSKLPNYAAVLDTIPQIDLYVLHLLRDPRAAAWSWMRGSASGAVEGYDEEMDRLSSAKSSILWAVWNGLTARRFECRPERYLRVRYEDVMTSPREAAEQIARWVGLDPASLPFVDDHEALLVDGHVVAGNPNRMGAGSVQFTLDRRWEDAMRGRDRATVTAITAPLMRRFGYLRKSA